MEFFFYRSILTVPWIELGGSVTITCPQTGYHCDIEFHTKPFYGGKKHRITAEVFGPKTKKSFLSITGEWNGSMEAKWADGVSFISNILIVNYLFLSNIIFDIYVELKLITMNILYALTLV